MYTKENSEIILENINDYFINIASDLLNQIKQNQKETLGHNCLIMQNIYSSKKPIFDQFYNINENEIIECVRELKNGSSPGIDG